MHTIVWAIKGHCAFFFWFAYTGAHNLYQYEALLTRGARGGARGIYPRISDCAADVARRLRGKRAMRGTRSIIGNLTSILKDLLSFTGQQRLHVQVHCQSSVLSRRLTSELHIVGRGHSELLLR